MSGHPSFFARRFAAKPCGAFRRGTLFLLSLAAAGQVAAASWTTHVSATLRETYDTNVYLQDRAPSPLVSGAVPARHESLVSSLAIAATAEWKPTERSLLATGYAPELVRFHSATEEDHAIHRLHLHWTGSEGAVTWKWQNTACWTDGSHEPPIFGGPHGAPAMGGIPVRDRRAAFVARSNLQLTFTHDRWIVRPAAALYVHDFRIAHRPLAGCSNFIDRNERNAGLDLGRELGAQTRVFAGFRVGRQEQGRLFANDSPYDSTIHRFLAGFESTPRPWLQLALLMGPETRHFAPGTPAGFDRRSRPLWIDASAKVTLADHTFAAALRRQQLPSSSSVGVYDDTACELSWRYRIDARFATVASVKLARGDWMAPAVRDDRIVSPGVLLHYTPGGAWQAELGWQLDRGLSRIPNTDGRGFRRHAATLALKYSR